MVTLLVSDNHIYPIICLKSVCLSGHVRRMQFAILAQSPREMSQTDRIHPMYFLSRVRVSIRPRTFVYAKKLQTSHPLTDRPGRVIFFPINAPGMGRFQLLNLVVLGYGLELRLLVVIAIIVSLTITITLPTTLTII